VREGRRRGGWEGGPVAREWPRNQLAVGRGGKEIFLKYSKGQKASYLGEKTARGWSGEARAKKEGVGVIPALGEKKVSIIGWG